jgi:uncharacterized membrane protein YdjX (TVP38/TMEM64 family)
MKLQNLVERLRNFKNDFGKIGSVAGLTTVLPSVGSMILLTFVYQFGPWLQANKEIGVMIFVSLMTFFSGLALVATNILGIVSGFAFNFQVGMLAQLAGLLGASTLMFILAKRYASENLQTKIEQKPKLQAFHSALLKENWLKTLLILILVRLSPAMPFAVTNFIISAAGISFRVFILGTVLGMFPRTFALVFVGSSLSELNFSEPQEAWVLILGIVATILAISVISLVGKRALNRLTIEQSA